MNSLNKVLSYLSFKYKNINFVEGDDFIWSSKNKTVTYKKANTPQNTWALIHEAAHAALGHTDYRSDHQLLILELQAWQKAKALAKEMSVEINQDHIEDCLDTYRNWISQRAACPNCQVVSSQSQDCIYDCFNCRCKWAVPNSPTHKLQKRILSK